MTGAPPEGGGYGHSNHGPAGAILTLLTMPRKRPPPPRRAGNRPLSPYLSRERFTHTPRSVAALERVRLRPRAVAGLSHERNQRNDTGTGRASLFPDRGVRTRNGRKAGAGTG